ncbi:EamA family transporter [Falsihalocynthiibacter sp. SS001]|uniref:EamA family transporter n=1 Tax=Falsihalocynthiibacter sp. SS001 TaxID=3349698 RepID=UPI0036D218EA
MPLGELIALLSAAFYGLAGVSIAKGRPFRRGDGGVFLSVATTALLTGILWLAAPSSSWPEANWPSAIGIFAIAGVFATVLGRIGMYRSTELIGSVGASMLRRFIPLFAIVFSVLLLGELPVQAQLIGGALILCGVLIFSARSGQLTSRAGILFGLGSAVAYALSYTLRKMGLEIVPDPIFATFVGAMAGVVCYGLWICVAPRRAERLRYLLIDRSGWFLCSALLLSFGQTLQLFALLNTSVTSVSLIGALDVMFTSVFAAILLKETHLRSTRFRVALAFVIGGTLLLSIG